jgi:hypothetical protein
MKNHFADVGNMVKIIDKDLLEFSKFMKIVKNYMAMKKAVKK